ncbi:MAG: FapA family protein [Oscillospiraceae bacterium]|nr:FapA family protein [Oscillospiraceae bacterium]
MKAKYFTATTFEQAEQLAEAHFNCPKAELVIDAISGQDAVPENAETGEKGIAGEPWTIVAIQGSHGEISQMNAFYTLYYEKDGVYLEIYEQRGRGKELDTEQLIWHLKRKNISSLNIAAVQGLSEKSAGRIKIAPEQKEFIYGEDISVVISGDEKEAVARLLEPEEGGALLTAEKVKAKLKEAGVLHGIDDEAVESWLSAKIYGEPQMLAQATPPIEGEDGKLIFHFSTDERTGAPREIGGGRVDYRSLDLYVPVTEDQLLVSRVAATEGLPGTTVRGNPIRQRQSKEAILPRGKNVAYNDDRTEMKSTCSGMVEFVNGAINVSNVYSIRGDCDMSVGNIDFDGSVHISGSVRSGSVVKATNTITVGGSVEAATIIAGGNVEIKGGMQGSGKGLVEAGGAVSILFVERGTIMAEGPISVDVSIHSTLETGSTIHLLGKRGALIGGSARAAGDVVASFLGSLSNAKTEVEVGCTPRKRARIEALEKDLERLGADRRKLFQLRTYLDTSKATMDTQMWEKLKNSEIANLRINDEDTLSVETEMQELRDELEHATESKVHVFETAFHNTRIVIGSSAYKITEDISYATFKYDDGEIVYGICEKNKTDIKK